MNAGAGGGATVGAGIDIGVSAAANTGTGVDVGAGWGAAAGRGINAGVGGGVAIAQVYILMHLHVLCILSLNCIVAVLHWALF